MPANRNVPSIAKRYRQRFPIGAGAGAEADAFILQMVLWRSFVFLIRFQRSSFFGVFFADVFQLKLKVRNDRTPLVTKLFRACACLCPIPR